MTYAVSHALQQGVYLALKADATLTGLVGSDVFDAPPSGAIPDLYVLIGDEQARDRSSGSAGAAVHDLDIRVVSSAAGFAGAKQVAGAVCDAVIGAQIALTRGRLVSLSFRTARALRDGSPEQRQIRLKFRAFVEDD
ncbi:DUF3168 domain-containing protein [Neptunicoccus cionae]|uniref:DUF3168 domain-containing protein n=1 Tax=Neptunicoccus cionae TaxID=2035344 RepID=UPI000C7659BB|nr:DUF3168 domain-containing protein [Amylibacter cionae]PLS22201.1 DUF3168 domain-containing protein [Amylibacter cionae]